MRQTPSWQQKTLAITNGQTGSGLLAALSTTTTVAMIATRERTARWRLDSTLTISMTCMLEATSIPKPYSEGSQFGMTCLFTGLTVQSITSSTCQIKNNLKDARELQQLRTKYFQSLPASNWVEASICTWHLSAVSRALLGDLTTLMPTTFDPYRLSMMCLW